MSIKTVAIRVDASNQIGTGHFMRCLTLADGLKEQGAKVCFVSRCLPEYLASILVNKNHRLIELPEVYGLESSGGLAHSDWLHTSIENDAQECIRVLNNQSWDWLVVDHYALDARWEAAFKRIVRKILVIDDLADRKHDADLLLDQNLYPSMDQRYSALISNGCRTLLGPTYALLRREFVDERISIRTRSNKIQKIFIFFGGSDLTNETEKSLKAIAALNRKDILVDVVIGAGNYHNKIIEKMCTSILGARLHFQVNNMAKLMSQADLAIGAGGSNTWERCALGLPSIVISVADNQIAIADGVEKAGAHQHLGLSSNVSVAKLAAAIEAFSNEPKVLEKMSRAASALVDGMGCERVIKSLKELV